jgi:hypothetical protein
MLAASRTDHAEMRACLSSCLSAAPNYLQYARHMLPSVHVLSVGGQLGTQQHSNPLATSGPALNTALPAVTLRVPAPCGSALPVLGKVVHQVCSSACAATHVCLLDVVPSDASCHLEGTAWQP